jgi:hypothetical protein
MVPKNGIYRKGHRNPPFSLVKAWLGKWQLRTISDGKRPAVNQMAKNRVSDPAPEPTQPPLALEKTQKGAPRSMWELLLQLRVLLPYLTRLLPLLDRGFGSAPDFNEITKSMAEVRTSGRDLEVQARNQALQLERIEQQMSRLRVVHENSIEESRMLLAEVRSLRSWMLGMAIVMFGLLLAVIVMVTVLLMHS